MRSISPTLLRSAFAAGLVAAVLVLPTSTPKAQTLHAQAQEAAGKKRPNILFIFSDDHAPHAISAYGSVINETPNIDRIAREGAILRNSFCGNSICGPSRATILTGLHTHANGFMRNGNRFDGNQRTFPKMLQAAGYQTAIYGKWHLTSDPTGFDHWTVLPGQGEYYNPDFITPDGRIRREGHATDLTTEYALEFLDELRDPDRPFLLMCQHKAPHRAWMPAPQDLPLYADDHIPEPPTLFDDYAGRGRATRNQEMEIDRHMYMGYDLMVPPDPQDPQPLDAAHGRWMKRMTPSQRESWNKAFAAENAAFEAANLEGEELVRWKYQRYIKNYLRCVAGVDRSVGTLLKWLDDHPDIKENTIVVYSSDQGFYLGDHGWYDKRWMYEESMRMPFVIRWPGVVEPGTAPEALVQNIDYAPTFLDAAGVPVPEDMHGRSMRPVVDGSVAAGKADWRDAVYYHYYESHAVHMVGAHYGVRTERYKLIRFYEAENGYDELFDLEKDPDELTSVADDPAYADIKRDLEARLVALRHRYGDDTGKLGDGAFQVTAGIATAERLDDHWRIWSNAGQGYALHTGWRPGTTVLESSVLPVERRPVGRHQRENGFLVAAGNDTPRGNHLRGGVEFKNGTLALYLGRQRLAEAPLENLDGPVELRMTVDLEARAVRLDAGDGTSIAAALPTDWKALSAWGYGASNACSVFRELTVY